MTRPARADRLWLWYLLAACIAGALIITSQQHGWTTAETVLYLPTVTAGTIGIAVGMIRYRPRAWMSWLLVACSQASFVAGTVAVVWCPSIADPLYLAMDVFLISALIGFVRSRVTPDQPAELLDAAIITTGAALMTWLHLIGPLARAHDVPLSERVVGMAYPLLDLMMFAVALRLSLVGGRRPPAYYLMVVGLSIYLATDIGYCYLRVTGQAYSPYSLIAICPLAGITVIGAAGLHPSMTRLDERPPDDATTATALRIAFLGAVALIVPGELVTTAVRATIHRSDILVIAGACAMLMLLILTRMAGLVAAHRHMAVTDPLTGLCTRRRFAPALADACSRAGRRGTQVGVLAIDIDYFKNVNDTYGHAAGDQVLREVARRLRSHSRPGDVVARIGGEEFAILVPDADLDTLLTLADRLREAVHAAGITVAESTISATVSIGAAVFPTDATTGEGALQIADDAMYEAKRSGRNRVVTSTGMGRTSRELREPCRASSAETFKGVA